MRRELLAILFPEGKHLVIFILYSYDCQTKIDKITFSDRFAIDSRRF